MSTEKKNEKRTRGWILLQVDSPDKTAEKLYEAVRDEGDDDYVIIRADVVDFVYNLIIPVDAANEDQLKEAHKRIVAVTGAKQSVTLPVLQTFPRVPHDAHGFITPEEAEHGHEHIPKAGRQHWSPGQNAWG